MPLMSHVVIQMLGLTYQHFHNVCWPLNSGHVQRRRVISICCVHITRTDTEQNLRIGNHINILVFLLKFHLHFRTNYCCVESRIPVQLILPEHWNKSILTATRYNIIKRIIQGNITNATMRALSLVFLPPHTEIIIPTLYRQFHEALGTWLRGRLLFSTNHSAWYISLKEFDWIKKVTDHEAMCQGLRETAC